MPYFSTVNISEILKWIFVGTEHYLKFFWTLNKGLCNYVLVFLYRPYIYDNTLIQSFLDFLHWVLFPSEEDGNKEQIYFQTPHIFCSVVFTSSFLAYLFFLLNFTIGNEKKAKKHLHNSACNLLRYVSIC